MPQLLLELFSEEIPARMQKKAAADLERMMMDGLTKAGLLPGASKAFSAPRRLALVIEDLAARTPDVREERKGPKVGAPQQAIDGFLRGAGLASVDQARVIEDAKKGDFYVADIVRTGQETTSLVAALVPDIIANFPWPKSMRWGEGALRWVRPLHRIVCIYDGEVVPFEVGGIVSGNVTEGHRFHGTGTFAVRDFEDYADQLAKAKVVLDRDERKAMLLNDARTLCAAQNLELVEDEGLAEEVTGLVDTPVVLMGQMDPAFLDLPPEVIRLTMRINQKYFVVRDPATGKLAPRFIVVSNVAATDGGAKIAAGNARVLSARLNDARYFWDLDRKTPLEDRVEKLDTLVFHEKLGSVGDKVKRIVALAGEIAPLVGADVGLAQRAALLAKADLTTGMVGEFPELEGVMGGYYAGQQGLDQTVADAIRDHYKPKGPSDAVPTDPVTVAVALADKIDTLTKFFAVGIRPTGSGDPFALRRAALGIAKIDVAAGKKVFIRDLMLKQSIDVVRFVDERFRVMLRDQGLPADIVEAACAGDYQTTYWQMSEVAKALAAFLGTDEGANLRAGFNRASKILEPDTSGAGLPFLEERFDLALVQCPEEKALFEALGAVVSVLNTSIQASDFDGAMRALASLRAPVDAFFEAVLVNDPDPAIRANRLALLGDLINAAKAVADFSKLAG